MSQRVKEIVAKLTLEEKASMCSGKDTWHTVDIPRLNVPSIMVADGPHGLRKQDEEASTTSVNDSKIAVCFPAACCTSSSFDPELLYKMGETLGDQCQSENVSVILGPAVNIKRSPLCGRNFEYMSEDPHVASKMSSGLIRGLQSQNVGACIKHFACNNQEYRRMVCSSEIDPRAIREIYLSAFEDAIKESQPWTVMCSYNKINGRFASENEWLLEKVLREEWGYEGFVMSDWGAVNDRIEGVKAGLELQMPGPCNYNDALLVKAVQENKLDEKILDRCCERILNIVFKAVDGKKQSTFDKEKAHEIARQVAEESIVLLKNEEHILPLKSTTKVSFIGEFAKTPRYQGSGSSHINPFKVSNAFDFCKDKYNVTYSQGYQTEKDEIDSKLEEEAITNARNSEVSVIFAGLPDAFESEGYDRSHLRMPDCQNHLIEEICKVQPNTIVVLHNGSPIVLPWLHQVKGVLEVYLGGQAIGEATSRILYGEVNPSGKLSETFPCRLEDTPSYGNFPGYSDKVVYREGIMVGYRYYDARNMEVIFPFGHGLSYTTFEYSNLQVDKKDFLDKDIITVNVDIKNTGSVAGKEIVQLYISDHTNLVERPPKELRSFTKVLLAPNETKTVTFTLNYRTWAYYDTELNDWHVNTGDYEILIGKSSRNIVLTQTVHVKCTNPIVKPITLNSTWGDLLVNPITKSITDEILNNHPALKATYENVGDPNSEFLRVFIDSLPLRSLPVVFPFDLDVPIEMVEKAKKLLAEAK